MVGWGWMTPENICSMQIYEYTVCEYANMNMKYASRQVLDLEEGIRGDRRGSEGIRGDQRGSEGIRGDRRGSEGIGVGWDGRDRRMVQMLLTKNAKNKIINILNRYEKIIYNDIIKIR